MILQLYKNSHLCILVSMRYDRKDTLKLMETNQLFESGLSVGILFHLS